MSVQGATPAQDKTKKKSSKEPIVARDALGQDITLGTVVVAPSSITSIVIGRIVKVSPMTVKVQPLTGKWLHQKRHDQVVVIGELPACSMYVIANSR